MTRSAHLLQIYFFVYVLSIHLTPINFRKRISVNEKSGQGSQSVAVARYRFHSIGSVRIIVPPLARPVITTTTIFRIKSDTTYPTDCVLCDNPPCWLERVSIYQLLKSTKPVLLTRALSYGNKFFRIFRELF